MKYLLINILTLFYLLSFSQNDSLIAKVFYYADGTISSQGYFLNGKPEAYWKTYYTTGIIKSEGNRVNSVLDGKWIFYDINSDTTEIINYRNQVKNGWNIKFDSNKVSSKFLYLDGKIIGLSYQYLNNSYLEIPYKNHLKHGLAFEYKGSQIIKILEYKNGYKFSEKEINRYLDSLKNGEWISFYPNRRIHIDAFYKNGILAGFYRAYDQQGNLLKNLYYENGEIAVSTSDITSSIFKKDYYDNGNIKSEGYYTDDRPTGLHKSFSNDGKLTQGILYDDKGNILGRGGIDKKGKKSAKWTFYDIEGKTISTGYYKKNRRIKTWTFYFSNGIIEQTGYYKSGKLNGEWVQYHTNATKFKVEHYSKGRLDGKYQQFGSNGDITIEGNYSDNVKDEAWIYYHSQLTMYNFYDKGIKTGKWYTTYQNGKNAFKGEFIDGLPNGKHIYFYSDGTIKEYQFYIFGSKEKLWSKYDAFTLSELTFLYKNNKLIKINGRKYNFNDNE